MDKLLQQYNTMQHWVMDQINKAMLIYIILIALGNLTLSGIITGEALSSKIQMSLLFYDVLFFITLFARFFLKKPKELFYYSGLILFQLGFDLWFNSAISPYSLGISGLLLVIFTSLLYGRGLKKFGNYHELINSMMDQIEVTKTQAELQSNELMGMYEELEANDEEVRAQYQEILENRDHLRLVQKRNSLLFQASNEVIWELDLKTGVRHFAEENYVDEVALDLIQSTQFEDWAYDLHPEDQKPFADAMRRVMDGLNQVEDFEIRVNNLQGGWKWLRSKVVSLRDMDGKTILMAGSYSDIDDRKQKERRIQQLAYQDPLTGLANRVSLLEHIQAHLLSSETLPACEGVFYYIDIDDFGSVNNTYGHDIGDRLIREIGMRLTKERSSDFIARIGGADFCVLSHENDLCEAPESMADYLLNLISIPFVVENKEIFLTASIGVSVYYEDISGAESVIRHGDIALRQAKTLGKNRFAMYHKSMSDQVSQRLLMGNELRTAIERGEMHLCYQPQINLENGQIFGFESLLRWNSPLYGLVPPNHFIPLAEETGLIIPIGKWVFEESCRFLKEIAKLDDQIMISVNVAAQQLDHATFLDDVRDILTCTGVCPEQVCIEVTESSVIKSINTAVGHLEQLKNERVKIALDDFGTGFSSLNYLNQLPIDTLKIDRSFTSRISGSSKEHTLIKAIIGLSSDLNLNLILEGIESREQLQLIEEMGSPIIQGYYYGKPMERGDAVKFIMDFDSNIDKKIKKVYF